MVRQKSKGQPWLKADSGSPFMGKKGHGSKRREDIVAERRYRVAKLLDDDMSPKQITKLLANPNSDYYMENPTSGKPFAMQTIAQDINALYGRSFTAEVVAARRALVRALRLRGLSLYEILAKMGDPRSKSYTPNPATGLPFHEETIRDDLKVIREGNYEAASQHTDQHRATQLAELEEVKRAGWAIGGDGGLRIVLRAIEVSAKLTGTEAPNVNVNIKANKNIEAVRALRDKVALMMEKSAFVVDVDVDVPKLPDVIEGHDDV